MPEFSQKELHRDRMCLKRRLEMIGVAIEARNRSMHFKKHPYKPLWWPHGLTRYSGSRLDYRRQGDQAYIAFGCTEEQCILGCEGIQPIFLREHLFADMFWTITFITALSLVPHGIRTDAVDKRHVSVRDTCELLERQTFLAVG
uniref:Uncharacterized protein n=1 Tax=Timema poppense TaxID=170557 RepID=A0A7R9D8V7_TIMPO|nr:unnamed protein product [Timema poppensis]